MEEIRSALLDITGKYDAEYNQRGLETLDALYLFSRTFYKDVSDIYECFTLIRNVERNPNGFSLNDAPILGLLVRVSKILKEAVDYYEKRNGQFVSLFDRSIVESSVMAAYLMSKDDKVIEDYRKCSYKSRLKVLGQINASEFAQKEKAGQRLQKSVRDKMAFENFTPDDFTLQKKNNWRVQGKTFYDIFAETVSENNYAATYGMASESIHGSWNESMDFNLVKNNDGTFLPYPGYYRADIRFLTPILRYTNEAYRLWLQRIEVHNEHLEKVLLWIESKNIKIFKKFDEHFDG